MLAASNPAVNLIGLGLVVLGLALLVATLAFWRSAIEDPEVLAPLEVMGERRYVRSNDFERFEILNDVRPGGPMPIRITTAPPPAREPAARPRRERRERSVPLVEPIDDHVGHAGRKIDVAPEIEEQWDDDRRDDNQWDDNQWDEAADDTAAIVPPVIDPLIHFQNNRRRD